MNIKIHDDQNTLIYRQDEYCQNFLLPQVPASFHTALLWGVMFSRAPVKWFPHSLGPKALGEGIMCLFYFGACSFASQDLHLSPGPSRILFSHAHSLQRIPLPQALVVVWTFGFDISGRTVFWGLSHSQPFSFGQHSDQPRLKTF